MERHIIKNAAFTKHPTQEGVFMKHFFSSQENDRLNNLEVRIIPNFMIAPHVHENSSEFFYVVDGEGEFLDNEEWKKIRVCSTLLKIAAKVIWFSFRHSARQQNNMNVNASGVLLSWKRSF